MPLYLFSCGRSKRKRQWTALGNKRGTALDYKRRTCNAKGYGVKYVWYENNTVRLGIKFFIYLCSRPEMKVDSEKKDLNLFLRFPAQKSILFKKSWTWKLKKTKNQSFLFYGSPQMKTGKIDGIFSFLKGFPEVDNWKMNKKIYSGTPCEWVPNSPKVLMRYQLLIK